MTRCVKLLSICLITGLFVKTLAPAKADLIAPYIGYYNLTLNNSPDLMVTKNFDNELTVRLPLFSEPMLSCSPTHLKLVPRHKKHTAMWNGPLDLSLPLDVYHFQKINNFSENLTD